MSSPAEGATVHGTHVGHEGLGKISGVDVQLEDGEDLIKQFLLMQVVKLKGGVHSVDDGVLVDKSWEGGNNSLDKGSGVSKVIHDHAARDHVVSAVHAVVESSDAVDMVVLLDVEHVVGVSGLDGVGDLMDFLDGDLFLVLGFRSQIGRAHV